LQSRKYHTLTPKSLKRPTGPFFKQKVAYLS
jgi:hypothetical protein